MSTPSHVRTAAGRSTEVELAVLMTQVANAPRRLTAEPDLSTPTEVNEILANLAAVAEAMALSLENLADGLASSIIDDRLDEHVFRSPDQARHTLGCLRAGASYAHGVATLLDDATRAPIPGGGDKRDKL